MVAAGFSSAAWGQLYGTNIYVCPMGHGKPSMVTNLPCPGKPGKIIHKASRKELIGHLRELIVDGNPDAAEFAMRNGLYNYYTKITKPGADPELDEEILWKEQYRAQQAANAHAEQVREKQQEAVRQQFEQARIAAQRSEQQQTPSGWLCTTDDDIWLQFSPCPSTVMRSQTINVNGETMNGQPAHGVGTVRVPIPVQSQPLDDEGVCDAASNGIIQIEYDGTLSSDVYARNVVKSKYCQ